MPPNLLPMVSTGRCSNAVASVASTRATMEPGNTLSLPVTGTLFCSRGTANCQATTTASDSAARAKRDRVEAVQVLAQGGQDAEEISRHAGHFQAQKVLDLRQRNQHRDAVGETDHHRDRNEADQRAQA
jgi:predicted transglutaminase-like cysteine proteinase